MTPALKLRPRACPICGSTDDSRVLVDADYDETTLDKFAFAARKRPEFMHFRMVCCPTCDLLYANPAPESSWFESGYETASFDAGEASRYAARTYARYLRKILPHLRDRSSALDIGTGDGAFLECLLAEGFASVAGVEPSAQPVRQARPLVRKWIFEGFFDPARYARESLSLVTCFQTLEHVEDPMSVCTAAFDLLKPGGAFFLVAHNYRSFLARLLGTRSPIYDVEHLQLHSPGSLRSMLNRSGFGRVAVRSIRNEYPISYWVRLLPYLRPAQKTRIHAVLESAGLAAVSIPVLAGNVAGVGYKAEA